MTVLAKVLVPGMMCMCLINVCCTEGERMREPLSTSTTIGEMLRKAIDMNRLANRSEFAPPVLEEVMMDDLRHPGATKQASSGIEISIRDWRMRIPHDTEKVHLDPGNEPSGYGDSVAKSTAESLAVVGPDFDCGVIFEKDEDRIKFTLLHYGFDDLQEALVTFGWTKKHARDMIGKAKIQLEVLSAETMLRMALATDQEKLDASQNVEEAIRLAMLVELRSNLNPIGGPVRFVKWKGGTVYVWSIAVKLSEKQYYNTCSYDEYGDFLWEGIFSFSNKLASEIAPWKYIFSNLFIPEVPPR